MDLMRQIELENMKTDVPDFGVGDTVDVHYLIRDGDKALSGVIDRFPQADRQHLRQLVREAQREKKADKPPAASRRLFRYLRELKPSE